MKLKKKYTTEKDTVHRFFWDVIFGRLNPRVNQSIRYINILNFERDQLIEHFIMVFNIRYLM